MREEFNDKHKCLEVHHWDDRKENDQSHEVYIVMPDSHYSSHNSCPVNPLEATGYGKTKFEAYCNMLDQFNFALRQLEAFCEMINYDALKIIDAEKPGE